MFILSVNMTLAEQGCNLINYLLTIMHKEKSTQKKNANAIVKFEVKCLINNIAAHSAIN